MNARLLNFSLCSICVHLAVPWLFLQSGAFEHGIARGMDKLERVLTVEFVSGETGPLATATPALAEMTSAPDATASVDVATVPLPVPAQETNLLPAMPRAADQDYTTAGRLTRLPLPLSDIDLNAPDISGSGFHGKVRLILRIDADGSVADVVSADDLAAPDEFTARVAARFRSARFAPGEIDGRPVKSQLQITVVSENPAAGG